MSGLLAIWGLLRRVPMWVWLVLALAGYVGALHWRAGQAEQLAAQHAARADAAEATAHQLASARDAEAALNTATRKAADDYRTRLAQARRTADLVRDERDRLLVAVDQAPAACAAGASAATAGGTDGAAVLRVVVRECTAALSQVAEAADACDARLSGLQAYVRAVVPPAQP